MIDKKWIQEGLVADEAIKEFCEWAMKHPQDAETFNAFAWQAAVHGTALESAETYASRAEGLARDMSLRASILDTRAEVVYKLQRPFESVDLEKQAMGFIDSVKDKKLFKELQAQLAKFEAAAQAEGRGMQPPAGQTNGTTAGGDPAQQNGHPAPTPDPTTTKYETLEIKPAGH